MAGSNTSSGEDYENWTWQQIKQAILGSAELSTADEENQLAGVSDVQSFYTAGGKFDFAASALNEVRESFAVSVGRFLGPSGSWGGDAAETLGGIMQRLMRQIDDYATKVSNNGYSNPLDTAGTNLSQAIQQVREADRAAAEAVVNRYKDDPKATQSDVPWRTDGASTIVDVSRYPDIEQQLTQRLREIIKKLGGAYQTATGEIKEPTQHAFVSDGKVVDTPNTTWIGDANDAPNAPVTLTSRQDTVPATSSHGKSGDKSSTKDTSSGGPSGKSPDTSSGGPSGKSPDTSSGGPSGKSSNSPSIKSPDSPSDGPSDDSGYDGSDSYSGKGPSSSSSVNPPSSSHPQIDTPNLNFDTSAPSAQPPSTPNFSSGNTPAGNAPQGAFMFGPGWNSASPGAPPGTGVGAKSSIKSPDLSGFDDKLSFDPETHVESFDPTLLGAPPGGHIETPKFSEKPLNLPGFENAVVPEDGISTAPIGNSLLSAADAKGVPTDFRVGNPPPPKMSNLRGISGEDGFLGPDGHLMLGPDGYPLPGQGSQHSYRGNGFMTEEEFAHSAAGHSGGFPGGYGGPGENPLGARGGMPMGGAGMPFREDEHGHGNQHSWLREDDDIWEQEKGNDKRKDGPQRGRR